MGKCYSSFWKSFPEKDLYVLHSSVGLKIYGVRVCYMLFHYFLIAKTHQRKDEDSLPRKRGQSLDVFKRSKGTSRKHGVARYSGWKRSINPWSHLDHHSSVPGLYLRFSLFTSPSCPALQCEVYLNVVISLILQTSSV